MEWMILPLKRYAQFEGRARRKEYWLFTLAVMVLYAAFFALLLLAGSAGRGDPQAPSAIAMTFVGLYLLTSFALLIPSLALHVRRFHDQDRTGWHVLLGLIPYAGWLIVLIMMCIPGTHGGNAYGEDPRGDEIDALQRRFE